MTGFDLDLARRAHSGTSFSPERRAEQEAADYWGHLAGVRERLTPLATTPELLALLETELAEYAVGYSRRNSARLAARSRVMSTMITGASNFPVRRNQKRLDTEMRRSGEQQEWAPKAEAAIRRRLLAARTPEAVEDAELARLKREIDHVAAWVVRIDAGEPGTSRFDRSWNVTGLVDKIRRVAMNGKTAAAAGALAYLAEKQAGWKKPLVTSRNTIWQVQAAYEAQRGADAAAEALAPTGEEVIAERDTVRAVRNHDLDRLQLFFPDKPEAALRQELKSSGWNWSPTNGCWQRKITANAEYVLTRIVEGL